jgi:hypothetical protein
MATWKFKFLGSYAGETDYEAISSDGVSSRVTFRCQHMEYFRQHYNGGPAAYYREVGQTLQMLRWHNFLDREMTQELSGCL